MVLLNTTTEIPFESNARRIRSVWVPTSIPGTAGKSLHSELFRGQVCSVFHSALPGGLVPPIDAAKRVDNVGVYGEPSSPTRRLIIPVASHPANSGDLSGPDALVKRTRLAEERVKLHLIVDRPEPSNLVGPR